MEKHHGNTTGKLCEMLALACGFSPENARQLKLAANMHDIGKRNIPASIIEKPGPLTPYEFNIVKLHTAHGYNLLQTIPGRAGELMREIAMFHHERYDGTGYWGLPREKQPVHIRIVAIVDVYTALIEKRCYKNAWPVAEAISYIEENAGSHFDPALVELFISLAQNMRAVPLKEVAV